MHGVPSMVCGVLFVVPKPKVWHADWCLYWPILRLVTWLDSVNGCSGMTLLHTAVILNDLVGVCLLLEYVGMEMVQCPRTI